MKSKDMIIKLKNLPDNTKKYIDEKTPIKIFPYELKTNSITGESSIICDIDLNTLEGGSIYMCPPNTCRLILQCKKLDGTFIDRYVTYIPNSIQIIIGAKNNTLMEIIIKDKYYKYYFASDTEEYKWEEYPLYLIYNNTTKYIPTSDYNPSTKKYVDDLVNSNKINMCTDEEFDSMLTSKLVVNEDNDDLVFYKKLPMLE